MDKEHSKKINRAYNELLASHERLRKALVELDAFCETGYEDGDIIRYVNAPIMEYVNEALKLIPKDRKGGDEAA